MAADFDKPVLSDDYATVLAEVRDNQDALATQLDDASPPNVPAGAKRWSTTNVRWEKYDGSSWLELAAQYAINVAKLGGYAAGNGAGQIPISNGTLNTGLNSEMLSGKTLTYFATAQGLTDLATKEAADIAAVNAKIDSNTTAINNKVSKSGDTMTGALNMSGDNYIRFNQRYMRNDSSANFLGFINNAGNNWTFRSYDNGDANITGALQTGGVVTAGTDTNNQIQVFPGSMEIRRWDGPYIDFSLNGTGQDYQWRFRNWRASADRIGFEYAGTGVNIEFLGDGNIYCSNRGYVWDAINGKIGGATCNWNTGIIETLGWGWGSNNTRDLPAPYVCCGIRTDSSGAAFVRGVALRNY